MGEVRKNRWEKVISLSARSIIQSSSSFASHIWKTERKDWLTAAISLLDSHNKRSFSSQSDKIVWIFSDYVKKSWETIFLPNNIFFFKIYGQRKLWNQRGFSFSFVPLKKRRKCNFYQNYSFKIESKPQLRIKKLPRKPCIQNAKNCKLSK